MKTLENLKSIDFLTKGQSIKPFMKMQKNADYKKILSLKKIKRSKNKSKKSLNLAPGGVNCTVSNQLNSHY
jgi:hypothetical protein